MEEILMRKMKTEFKPNASHYSRAGVFASEIEVVIWKSEQDRKVLFLYRKIRKK